MIRQVTCMLQQKTILSHKMLRTKEVFPIDLLQIYVSAKSQYQVII